MPAKLKATWNSGIMPWTWYQKIRIQILFQTLPSCVPLGRSLHFFVPISSSVKGGTGLGDAKLLTSPSSLLTLSCFHTCTTTFFRLKSYPVNKRLSLFSSVPEGQRQDTLGQNGKDTHSQQNDAKVELDGHGGLQAEAG